MITKAKLQQVLENNPHKSITAIFAICLFILQFEYVYDKPFGRLMSMSSYLTWHIIFEFTSILITMSIFFVTYYTYSQNHNLRSFIFGSGFLSIAIIDFMHTMSYKGMPPFFIDNTDPNRATLLWVFSSLITGIIYVTASYIPANKKTGINKSVFVILPFIIGMFIFIIATYFPYLVPTMYDANSGLTFTKIVLEYFSMALYVYAMIRFIREFHRAKDYLLLLIAIALLTRVFAGLAFTNYTSVYGIYNYIGHIFKTISMFLIFKVLFIYNVQKPYVELTKSQNKLKLYLNNLNIIVETRTKDLKIINDKLLDDLQSAKDIQQSMLPKQIPLDASVSFDFNFFPAQRVSGDFYDVFRLDNEKIGFYIADVSGHGVSASMLTVFLKQSIEVIQEKEADNTFKVLKPSEVLKDLYTSFNNTRFKDEMYIVIFYGVYNTQTKNLTYCSAGFNTEPILLKADGKKEFLPLNGFPICKFIDYYTPKYKDFNIFLNKGDKLFVYTDGLIENRNSKNEPFGENRLMDILNSKQDSTTKDLANTIYSNVFNYVDDNEFKDDITYLIMNIK